MKDVIIQSDCIEGMKALPSKSVHCCVTSPPYFGLRDYGVEGQLGLEDTPEAFIGGMVKVFREVRRVLKDDGTLWLNIGDSYNSSPGKRKIGDAIGGKQQTNSGSNTAPSRYVEGLKPKDLIGIPWMLAFALRADGWFLRQDIIWSKPNPMPESVTDRCTKAHEYIFLLSKSAKYYFDAESIKQPISDASVQRLSQNVEGQVGSARVPGKTNGTMKAVGQDKANKRSVWNVTTKPFREAHFATFPPELIVDCIKAGSPIGGLVLDPFMGAGTTGLVAKKLSRHYIGFEINPAYIAIAEARLKKELGLFH